MKVETDSMCFKSNTKERKMYWQEYNDHPHKTLRGIPKRLQREEIICEYNFENFKSNEQNFIE